MNYPKRTSQQVAMVLIGLGCLLIGCASPAVQAQNANDLNSPTLSVWGKGQATVQPDRAVLTIGVETSATQASAALSQNNKQLQTTIAALQQAGVDERDIQTQSVQIYSRYELPPASSPSAAPSTSTEASGYTAINVVQVIARDLNTLGALLDAAVAAGGNRIQGLRFEVSDPNPALQQARELAWQDAQNKAQQLAALSGLQLGPVMSVQESSAQTLGVTAQAAASSQVPIEPGTQALQIDLNVTWQVR